MSDFFVGTRLIHVSVFVLQNGSFGFCVNVIPARPESFRYNGWLTENNFRRLYHGQCETTLYVGVVEMGIRLV